MGFNGPQFTWSNKRVGWANIRERLDRGICNSDWQSLFPKAGVRHLIAPNSDHILILLDTHLELSKGSKPFHFEAMWARDTSSAEVVEKAWDIPFEGSQSFRLVKRFQSTRKELCLWNCLVFGFVNSRIKEIEEKIKAFQDRPPT